MGCIKIKYFAVFGFFFVISSIFSIIFIDYCRAEDNTGVDIIGTPSYRLTNSIVKNGIVLGKTFQINVTLHNSDSKRSEQLEVNLSEGTDSLVQTTILEAGETKVISFTWSTVRIQDQKLLISFYPKDLDATWNEYNYGSTFITIDVIDDPSVPATNTPGFELIITIIAIICVLLIFKKRIKK